MQPAASYGQTAPPFCITSGFEKSQQQKEIIRRNLSASCSSHTSHKADVVLTKRDIARGETLLLLAMGVICPDEARGLLRVSRSQMYKLLARYRQGGVAAISSKKCGSPSNRSLPRSFRKSVLEIIKQNYQDFGPTLISEMLDDFHGIKLSVETLRQWMIAAKIWFADRAKRRRIHRPRNRKTAYGDLLQVDGSSHDWFEHRGPQCTLMVMVDDATGRLQALEFVPQEDRNAYVSITSAYITRYGRPVRIQTDRHAAVWSDRGPTDYGKALGDLNIIHSIAYSPQSKGRVERVNRTLQDRLVKAMRLQGISSIKQANEYAPEFIKVFNHRFAKQAIALTDHHRRLLRGEDLNSAFAVKHIRRLTKNLSFSFKGQQYVIENGQGTRDVIGKKIVIEIQHGGNMLVRGAKGPVAVRPVE